MAKDLIGKTNFAYASDLVIFGIDSNTNLNKRGLPQKKLSILLIWKEDLQKWCLPGVFVGEKETSREAAIRGLYKETKLKDIYLNKLSINDEINRDYRGRVVSTSYLSLIDKMKITEGISEDASWFDITYTINEKNIEVKLDNTKESIEFLVSRKSIDQMSNEENYEIHDENKLGFDHETIIVEGLMRLREKVETTDIVFHLLPEYFTIGELEKIYETILNKKIINSVFRRKMNTKFEIIDKQIKTGGHRPSALCKYKGE